MDPRKQLDEILPLLDKLVVGLDAAQLDAPTVCAGFAVRDVLTHMITGATVFSPAFRGDESPAPESISVPTDPAELVAAFPVAMSILHDSVWADGAMERTINSPMGPVPGEVFIRFTVMDGMVHGYDISQATGQQYDPPADVVAATDAFTRQAITPEMRDGDTFAAEVTPPAGASPLVSLVAFTGRTV